MSGRDFEITVLTDPPWPVPAGAGAGLTRVLEEALTRAGIEGSGGIGGQLWISDRWQAELELGGERHAEEAAFERGHHLLARLAEAAARAAGAELPRPVLASFDDLATPAPLALLHYFAGRAASGALTGRDAGESERRRLWRRAFELDPNLRAVRSGLASELLAEHQPRTAAALLAGVALQDGFAAAELGLGLWAEGETEVSFELLQSAVGAHPEHALAMAALATLLARRASGDESRQAWDEALLLATQATQLASDDFRTWAALAGVHRAGGDCEQAGFYYNFALRLEPSAPTVLKDASACWLEARQPQHALPLIERARAAAPADAENAGNLAFAHRLLGDRAAALAAAREAAVLGPGDARFHILHGEMALEAGERDEALDAWARAAALEPGVVINPEGGNLGVEAG